MRQISSVQETPDVQILLAEALGKKGGYSEAIAVLIEFLQNNPEEPLAYEANRLLIRLYGKKGDWDRAKEVSENLRTSNPTEILNLVDRSWIYSASGNTHDALASLQEAKKYLTESSTFRQKMELADEFYSLDQFEDAAEIYVRLTNKSLDTPLTRRLLHCYYRSGDMGKALEICQTLRQAYGPLEFVAEMESFIYEEIGDLPEARRVCQEYLILFPNDFEMRLRLAVVNFLLSEVADLDEFLKSDINFDELSLQSGVQLVHLYAKRTRIEQSYSLMYELRRKFYNDPAIHLAYFHFMFQYATQGDNLVDIKNISTDVAVCIEEEGGRREWYVIEDRKNANSQMKEINLEHPLAQKLLGKSIEDEIVLKESFITKGIGKIVELKSKYIYALHDILLNFEKLFPDTPGIWGVKVGKPQKVGGLPQGFDQILKVMDQRTSANEEARQLYRDGKITIGGLARLLGRNPLETISILVNDADTGLLCSIGSIEERNAAFS